MLASPGSRLLPDTEAQGRGATPGPGTAFLPSVRWGQPQALTPTPHSYTPPSVSLVPPTAYCSPGFAGSFPLWPTINLCLLLRLFSRYQACPRLDFIFGLRGVWWAEGRRDVHEGDWGGGLHCTLEHSHGCLSFQRNLPFAPFVPLIHSRSFLRL